YYYNYVSWYESELYSYNPTTQSSVKVADSKSFKGNLLSYKFQVKGNSLYYVSLVACNINKNHSAYERRDLTTGIMVQKFNLLDSFKLLEEYTLPFSEKQISETLAQIYSIKPDEQKKRIGEISRIAACNGV